MNLKKIKNNLCFMFYPIVFLRAMSLAKQIRALKKDGYIVFMLFWKMGDIILSTRIVHEVKKKNPSAKICYIASESFKFAIKDNSEIDEVLTVKMYGNGRLSDVLNASLWFLCRKFVERSRQFDKRYFLQIYPEYIGDLRNYKKHLIDFYAEKVNIKLGSRNPYFLTKKNNEEFFEELCNKKGLKKKMYVVIGHIASAREKTWPIEKFEELGREILKTNPSLKIIFIGAKEDRYPKDKRFILIKGENLGNVAEIIKNSRIFVGLDSGLIHLATAFNQHIFGIYSGYAPLTLSSPLSKNLTIVKSNNLKKLKVSEVFNKIKNNLQFV